MPNGFRHLPAMLLVLGVTVGTPACAAQIYASRGGYYQDSVRRAYDNGYRLGVERGRDDLRHRRAFDYGRYGEYRNGDRGYRREDGNRDTYRQSFRQGFLQGYREVFERGYGNSERRGRR